MSTQDKREGEEDNCSREQTTSFFKTALEYEDYKSEQLRRLRDVNRKSTGMESESSCDAKISTTKKSDLAADANKLNVRNSVECLVVDSEQKTQAMLNRITAHIRVQSPTLASAVKSEDKSPEEQTHAAPQRNKMLSLMRQDKSTSSQEGESNNPRNMLQLIKLRNIARNVKSIQHDRQKHLENTGNVTLYDKFRKFDHKEAEESMKSILEGSLEHVVYEPKQCKILSMHLSDKIRNTVKRLKFPRYKFVSFVTIGQKGNQDVVVASRCVWNTDDDSYASVRFENKTLFANAVVFALLHE